MISDNRDSVPGMESQATPLQLEAQITPFPPKCNPARHLDWRWQCVMHLIRYSPSRPFKHEDELVRMVAERVTDERTTPGVHGNDKTYQGIAEACQIADVPTLERDIMEACLLAQQEPAKIAARVRFSPWFIAVYAVLFFDVWGDKKGLWMTGSPSRSAFSLHPDRKLGSAIKMFALTNNSGLLNQALDVVFGLEGTTMADGLPDSESTADQLEFMIRLSLAEYMQPRRSRKRSLKRSFGSWQTKEPEIGIEAPPDAVEDSPDRKRQFLRRARLKKSLRREIQQLREYVHQGTEAS